MRRWWGRSPKSLGGGGEAPTTACALQTGGRRHRVDDRRARRRGRRPVRVALVQRAPGGGALGVHGLCQPAGLPTPGVPAQAPQGDHRRRHGRLPLPAAWAGALRAKARAASSSSPIPTRPSTSILTLRVRSLFGTGFPPGSQGSVGALCLPGRNYTGVMRSPRHQFLDDCAQHPKATCRRGSACTQSWNE